MHTILKIFGLIAIILGLVVTIQLKTHLFFGGDFFSSKNIFITGIIVFGIIVSFLIVHIIELINKNKKS